VLVALVLDEDDKGEELVDEEDMAVDEEVGDPVDSETGEEEIEAVELEVSVVDVDDAIGSVPLKVVVTTTVVGVTVIDTLVEVAVFTQEHPLDILDGESEHAVAQAGSVAVVVAVV
jgi:hypothetical protein